MTSKTKKCETNPSRFCPTPVFPNRANGTPDSKHILVLGIRNLIRGAAARLNRNDAPLRAARFAGFGPPFVPWIGRFAQCSLDRSRFVLGIDRWLLHASASMASRDTVPKESAD